MELKIALIIFFVSVTNVFAVRTYSQAAKVTLNIKNQTLEQVIDEIEQQSEFYFIFNQKQIDINRIVDIQADKKLINDILPKLFNGTNVNYAVLDRKILLTTDTLESKLIAVASDIGSQQQIIRGTVTNSGNGEAMAGVNVVVKGTTIGAITDINGSFSLSVPDRNAILVVSFIGFVTTEVSVGNRSVVDIALTSEALALEEVVVIGYGTQKKINVIGSVVSISTKELTASPTSTVGASLGGRLPGLIVSQTTGEPGRDDADLLIRGKATLGNTSVLIVVDGIPGRDLNSIEPGDIESLTVLKDASAGIYGSRAANGVILVTTKKGIEGAPRFEYDFYQGWAKPTLLPEMTDAATYAQLINEMKGYRGLAPIYTADDISKYQSGDYPWTHPNSDWFEETFKEWTGSNHHSFRVTGGSKAIRYFASFGYQSDNGLYKRSATSYKRYNFKTNLDVAVNENISINFDVNASEEDMTFPTKSTSSIFTGLIRNFPNSPAVWPNGLYGPDIEYGDQPLATSTFDAGFDDTKHFRINPMLTATVKIPWVKGLSVVGNYAYDMYFQVRKVFVKPVTLYFMDKAGYLAAGNDGSQDGSAFLTGLPRGTIAEPQLNDYYYDAKTVTNSLKVNYERTFGVHSVSAFAAVESMDYSNKGIQGFRRFFISDQLPYLSAGGTDLMSNNSSISIDARLNYFGRVSYNYSDKYLLEFTLRRDGSLRFSKDAGRWGTFPSALIGWRASSEDFWKNNIKFINYFKLKGSWGQMGNDAVNAFQYLTLYGFNTGLVSGTSKTYSAALSQVGSPNPAITWEVANILNGGLESAWFDSKVTLDFDAFYQKRSNILVKKDASVPGFTGISLPDENFGIVESHGFEAVLGYNNKSGNFSYSFSGNLAFARSNIVEYDEPVRSVDWQVMTGHPIGATLQYNAIGIFDSNAEYLSLPHVSDSYNSGAGGIIIEDRDLNGTINADDRIIYDLSTTPEITYGVTINLAYKNFTLSTLFQGVGNTWYRANFPIMGTWGNYFEYYADGRWTPDNTTAEKPRIFERTEDFWRDSYTTDFDYYNHAFCRWKNLEIAYNVPQNLLKNLKMKDLKVYFSGQNLALLYNAFEMKMDPETDQVDSYPLAKIYAVGVKVAF